MFGKYRKIKYYRVLKAYEGMKESYERSRRALIGPNPKLDSDYIAEENKEFWGEQNAKSPEKKNLKNENGA